MALSRDRRQIDYIASVDHYNDIRFAFQSSFDGIVVADNEGRVLLLNPAFRRVTGVAGRKVLGHKMADLLENGTVTDSGILRALETGEPRTVQLLTAGKREVLSSACPVYDRMGHLERVVCNVRSLAEFYRLPTGKNETTLPDHKGEGGIVAKSEKMLEILRLADRLAKVNSNLLITGETGVGKGLIARFIYEKSPRAKNGPFIKVNCAAVPPSLFESELFGYERGAFTGALGTGKPGFVEIADKGVLFLDEIGDLPLELQSKLLNVIEDHHVTRVGGRIPREIDLRIIGATNKHLGSLMASGSFREDLYFRLAVVPLHIPPLRERSEDVVPLLLYFAHLFSSKHGAQKTLSPSLCEVLSKHSWPGNTRELANLVEYLFVVNPDKVLELWDLPCEFINQGVGALHSLRQQGIVQDPGKTLKQMVEEYELELVHQAINKTQSYVGAARLLGTSLSTINRKAYQLKTLQKSQT